MSAEERAPLLLHSLATFEAEILRCLDIAEPRRIIEIGSETGASTLVLAEWAERHDASVVCVDPDPAAVVVEHAGAHPTLEVVAGASPGALDGLDPADAYVIDGDHNHWTVSRELAHAYGSEDRRPLCILHDVSWPSARRDQYYAPERIPPEGRRPHSFEGGVVPGNPELVRGGFRGAGAFAWAEQEGGPANGVLTAVEDLLARREDLRLVRVPAVFGVGYLWSREAPYAEALEAEVGGLHEDPLLARLEGNRLGLYLEVLELHDRMRREALRADRVITDLQAQVGRLDAECSRLRLEALPDEEAGRR